MKSLLEIRKQNFETNITGLDELLRGGFVLPTQNNADEHANGLVILIKGKPGTGKTTFAMQLLYHLTQVLKTKIDDFNHSCKSDEIIVYDKKFLSSQYFSIEQSQDELEEKLMNMVIYRIFNDMQSFVVSDESIISNYSEKEKKELNNQLTLLKNLFPTTTDIFCDANGIVCVTDYLPDQYKSIKFFFENYQYDRSNKKIVATKYFQTDEKEYNFIEILKPENKPSKESFILKDITYRGKKINSVNEFDILLEKTNINIYSHELNPDYARKTFLPHFTHESIDENIIEELIKRLGKYFTINADYKLDHEKIKALIDEFAKNEIQNFDSIKGIISTYEFKNPDVLTEQVCQEFASLIQSHYFSHIPQEFSVEIKTAESVHSKADSPFNFMSAQKVHEFINEIEDESETKEKFYPCIVTDGLNILSEKEKKLINIGKLVKTLKNNSLFNIIVYDGEIDGSLYQDYYADLVIELKGDVEKNLADYFLHQLQITKSRFQQAALGWHQYKIRELGIQVFRSVHFHVHINNYQSDQLLDSFRPAIDLEKFEKHFNGDANSNTRNKFVTNIEKILIAPAPGSFTAIFGARATFKTTLTLEFLFNVNQKVQNENGDALLVSLIDNYETLKKSSYCPMAKFRLMPNNDITSKEELFETCKMCHKHLYILHQRSGCVNSHEFFHNLDKHVSEHEKKTSRKITRMAFWDLAQLEFRFPLLSADPMFLPGLVEYTKKKKIALIVMGAGNSKLTPAASAIADNVIFCWRSQIAKNSILSHNLLKENRKSDDNADNNLLPIPGQELNKGTNVLCLYVDRCQGQLGNEGKELTFIPVMENSGIEIQCLWENKMENGKYPSTGFNKLESQDLIAKAQRTIETIIDMQGMGSVNR